VGLANPLSPSPLALEDTAQRLTARRAAKPLAGTALRGNEVVFAPGTVAGEKLGFVGGALALAGR
jgi:hypothetical protein